MKHLFFKGGFPDAEAGQGIMCTKEGISPEYEM
jgi:hypothetical protein